MRTLPIVLLPLIAVLSACESSTGDDEKKTTASSSTTTIRTSKLSEREGDVGISQVQLRLSRAGSLSRASSVRFELLDGSAVEGEDYYPKSGIIEFSPNQTTTSIAIELVSDHVYERDEVITVRYSALVNARMDRMESEVVIVNDDEYPKLEFAEIQQQVAENSSVLELDLILDNASQEEVTFELAVEGTAINGQDYNLDVDKLPVFAPLQTTATLILDISEDLIPEGGETINLDLHSVINADAGDNDSSTVIILGDIALNDTGYVHSTNGSSFDLTVEPGSHPGQDATKGRDTRQFDDFDGVHAFSFTKVDGDGNTLPATADNQTCIKDNVTGLVWEVKREFNGINCFIDEFNREICMVDNPGNYRASNFLWYWFNSDKKTSGGSQGFRPELISTRLGWHYDAPICAFPPEERRPHKIACDSEAYIDEINWRGLCGFKDWRLPDVEELRGIANYDQSQTNTSGRLDVRYFPYGYPDGSSGSNSVEYFSRNPDADNDASAWCFNPFFGFARLCHKGSAHYLRLVRSGENE